MTHSSTDNNVKSGATIADSLKYAELQMAAEAFQGRTAH